MLPIHTMPGYLIRRAHQISTARFAARLADAGSDLTPVQFGALTAIRHQPGLDQATLAEAIAYDRVTIGGVLDRLQAKGLILRSISKSDRRARCLDITPAGAALLDQLRPVIEAVQAEILSGLNDDEREVFVTLLKKVQDVTDVALQQTALAS